MRAKGWGVLLVTFLMVTGAAIGIAGLTSIDVGQNTSHGANNVAGLSIVNGVSQVVGYNYSKGVWYTANLTLNPTTNSITATFLKGDHVGLIVVQTKNTSMNAYNLLQDNAIFSSFTFANGLGSSGNLSSAFMYLGTPVNSTANNNVADKGVINFAFNQTLFSSTQTSLNGKTVQLDTFAMFAQPLGTPQYMFHLNGTGNATFGYSFVFTQSFQSTSSMPLYSYVMLIGLVSVLLAGLIGFVGSPEHFGAEDERAGSWYKSHKEEKAWKVYAALGGVGLTLVLIALLGYASPLFGYGGAIAFLVGFATFDYGYSDVPDRQKLSHGIGVGILGGVILILINIVLPFGPIAYGGLVSGNLPGQLYSIGYVIVSFGIAYVGMINLGRYKLRERGHLKLAMKQ